MHGVVEHASGDVDISEAHGSVDLVGVALVQQRLVHLRSAERATREQNKKVWQNYNGSGSSSNNHNDKNHANNNNYEKETDDRNKKDALLYRIPEEYIGFTKAA